MFCDGELISQLRCQVELSSYLAQPRDGHLNASFHTFNYVEKKHSARIVFDPTYSVIDMSSFQGKRLEEYYGNVKEAIPPNVPEPQGKKVNLCLFVDSDHAGCEDQRTRELLASSSTELVTYFVVLKETVHDRD